MEFSFRTKIHIIKKKEIQYEINEKILITILSLIMIFNFISVNSLAASDVDAVSIISVVQSRSNWCWAACSRSILNYFGNGQTQNAIVIFVKGELINEAATSSEIQSGLSHWGVSSTVKSSYISFTQVISEISTHSRPFMVCWRWNNGLGGHVVVVNGYDNGNTDYVQYMDPYTGQFYSMRYSACKGGSSSDRTWNETIYKMSR